MIIIGYERLIGSPTREKKQTDNNDNSMVNLYIINIRINLLSIVYEFFYRADSFSFTT